MHMQSADRRMCLPFTSDHPLDKHGSGDMSRTTMVREGMMHGRADSMTHLIPPLLHTHTHTHTNSQWRFANQCDSCTLK